jgi:thermolysin
MRRLTFLVPAIVAMGACGGPEPSELAPPTNLPTEGVTSEQQRAFFDLETRTKKRWTWAQHARFKTPMHLSTSRTGKPVLRSRADAEKITLSFLDENKALFKMRDPSAELAIERSEVDEVGMTHVRFRQLARGVPVVGAELAAHYDEGGRIAAVDANYVAGLGDLDVHPKLDPEATRAIVETDVLSRTPSLEKSDLETGDAKLVVLANGDGPPRLAYERTVRAVAGPAPAVWVMTVDATTGEIIDRYDNLQRLKATAPGVFGDAKSFEVTQSGDEFRMTDTTGPAKLETRTAEMKTLRTGKTVSSQSLTDWDRVATGAGAAVDAHAYTALVLKYYKERHQRRGFDGAGGRVIATVHYDENFENAFWSEGMFFGDGGEQFHPFSCDLTVVAHEFSHGVTGTTSGLIYRDQPGALNEAFSDIISIFVGHAFEPNPKTEWKQGFKSAKSISGFRDLADPHSNGLPAAMSEFVQTTQDNGGVHTNSTIISHAAFLMTVGGTNSATKLVVKTGLGWEKSEKLWYRANTRYFMGSTDFGQAALAVLTAAKDLGFTKNERRIVADAFTAVGLATPPEPDEPGPATSAPPPPEPRDASAPNDESSANSEEPPSTSEEPSPKRKLVSAFSCDIAPPRKGNTPFSGLALLAFVLRHVRAVDRRARRTPPPDPAR